MRQTDTPEFKRWFQGSVVVDERGEPLVVYHGTLAPRFNVFETPAYFAESPDEASAYSFATQTVDSDRARSYYRKASGAEYAGSRVPYTGIIKDLPEECRGTVCATDEGVVRVNSRHSVEIFTDLIVVPGSWRDDETIEIAAGASKAYEEAVESLEEYLSRFPGNRGGGHVYPVYLSIKNPKVLSPLQGNRFAKRLHAGAEEVAEIERLKAEGYDGIATTSDEASFFPEVGESLKGRVRQFIAFYPEQIKSAVGNQGTFDPSNPSIFEGVDMNLTLGKVYSKAEMLKAGADGFLDHALLTKIPVNLITGREPTPSMEGGYKEGTPITQPVEVMFDRDSNSFVLYAGNHRVTQAEINGEDSILAFVEDPLRKYEELKSTSDRFGDMPSLDVQKLASRLDVSEDFAKVVIAAISRLGLRNYRIQPTALGCGSEGCVFPATDAQGREVVVKVSESDSDLNAAAWLKKNPHPMFPVVYAVFQLDGFKAYASRGIRFNVVVREDIPSGHVDSHVLYAMTLAGSAMRAAERQFPDAAKYLKDVQAEAAKASDAANARRVVEWCQWCMERGVVFEDVSEDNVGVRENGEVVLRDFGFNRTPKASRVLFADYPMTEERLHLSGFGAGESSAQKLVEASLAEFGTTRDIREAGFILPDGRMLDLSGKNDGGNPGERSRDHYEIAPAARKAGIQGERYDVLTGVLKRGFIRISYIPSNRYFAAHFGAHPTSAQARALAAFVKACDSANVDVEVGKKTHTYELEGRVTVRKVLDAVEQHYPAPADFGSNVGPEDSEDWSDGEPGDFEGFGDDAPDPYSLKRPHIGGKRQRRVSACASDNLDLKWMRLDSCISRAGGTLKQATIHSPDGVSNFMHEVVPIANMGYEEFYVIPVDTKHVPLGVAKIAQGGVSSTVVDRVLVLRPAVMLGAKAMFIVHNHPSGNASPSNDDIVLTKAIKQAAETIGVPLLDHVIVTPDRRIYYSFVEGGIR